MRHRHSHHHAHAPWEQGREDCAGPWDRVQNELHRLHHHGDGTGPWDRVHSEVRGRRPGWRRRIQRELHLYYGAHLHRKIFFWFGAVILLTVLELLAINHFFHSAFGGKPWRAFLCFGLPTVLLWSASGKLARRISRPVYELTRVAERIGEGDLAARAAVPRDATGELAMLASSVNDMAARISGELARQRELLAAVSHELRTPLSRMRLVIEIAREGGVRAETLNEIERETIEIDALVGELLASARLDFQAVARRPLDALEVGRRALERAGLPANKLVSERESAPLSADPTLLARALANLIDNARKHGGGLDTLAVSVEGDRVIFTVTDRGPGFAEGEETRVFASFYRGQHADAGEGGGAHSGLDRAGSLGLGLALVKRIAEAHGGSVRAANRAGGGAVLTLELGLGPAV
jgi:two-component system OmpR family sensor kinase